MRYMKVVWLHNFDDEPQFIYSEIDDASFESRKVEIYKDNSFGLASREFVFGGTVLAERPIPEIEAIAGDTGFLPSPTSQDEFEKIWLKCVHYLGD